MRILRFAVLGVLAYLVFLAATVPAAFVAAQVERETRGALHFEEARGTLWSGQARASGLPIQWRLRPASLAAGRVGFDIHVNEAGLKAAGEVGRSLRAWHVQGLKAEGSAAAAAALLPVLAPWRPEGSVVLDAPSLAWTDSAIEGAASLEWRAAAIGISDVRPLGTYRAQLRGEGGEARIALATLDGALRLAGRGTLTPRGQLAFRGEARAEGPQAGALQPLLDLIGPRRPDGSRTFGVGSGSGPK